MTIEEIIKSIKAGDAEANRAFREFYGTFNANNEAVSSELRIKMAKHINKKFRVTDDTIIDIIIEDAIIKIFEIAPKLELEGINGWFWKNLDHRAIDYFRREATQNNNKKTKLQTFYKYENYRNDGKKYSERDRALINKKVAELERFNETDSKDYIRLLIIKDEIDLQFEDQDRARDIKEIEENDIAIHEDDDEKQISKRVPITGVLNWGSSDELDEINNDTESISHKRSNLKSHENSEEIDKELVDCMKKGLLKLEKDKPEHSKVLTLRFIEGNSIDEIKDQIGRTADATKTFIHYCLKTDISYFEECH